MQTCCHVWRTHTHMHTHSFNITQHIVDVSEKASPIIRFFSLSQSISLITRLSLSHTLTLSPSLDTNCFCAAVLNARTKYNKMFFGGVCMCVCVWIHVGSFPIHVKISISILYRSILWSFIYRNLPVQMSIFESDFYQIRCIKLLLFAANTSKLSSAVSKMRRDHTTPPTPTPTHLYTATAEHHLCI